MAIEIMGYLAAFLTTAAFLPQTYKINQSRDTKAISLAMYVMFTLGVALWLVYGILLKSWPLIVANGVTVLMAITILILKLKER